MAKLMLCGARVIKNDPESFRAVWRTTKVFLRELEPYVITGGGKRMHSIIVESMAVLEQTDTLKKLKLEQEA